MSKKKNMYKLESLARLISGRTPEREQKEYYAETGTPWVKIENLDQEILKNATNSLKLQELMKEKGDAEALLEEKMDRWVYLNDLAQRIEEEKENG